MRGSLLGLAMAACAAAPAQAAEVSLEYEGPVPGVAPDAAYSLVVEGGAESSRLTVAGEEAAYRVEDSAAPLSAGPGCAAVDAMEAVCALPEPARTFSIFVRAGAGNDQVSFGALTRGEELQLDGGAGDDVLSAAGGADVLSGGPGRDWLVGWGGPDRLSGGPGDDLIDGRDGRDAVSYLTSAGPVRLDLGGERATEGADTDIVRGIEDVIGSRGADRLWGDGGPNRMVGGQGDAADTLAGRGGDDYLSGRRVVGGDGDDRLDGSSAACGPGDDRLVRETVKPLGPFAADCETVFAGFYLGLQTRPRLSGRTLRLSLTCPVERCRGSIEPIGGPRKRYAFQGKAVLGIRLQRPPRGDLVTLRFVVDDFRRDSLRLRLLGR